MTDYPKYFLGETEKEAEEVHNAFVGILNNIAKEYSLHTGLDKGDLFNEALFGLANAVKKFDKGRSTDFKAFAIFKIKDHLNQYVREFGNTIKLPRYINDAINIVNRIDKKLEYYGIGMDITTLLAASEAEFEELSDKEYYAIKNDINMFKNLAERASMTAEKLLKRVEYIPIIVESEAVQRANYETSNSIEFSEILSYLDEEESCIAMGIAQDKTKTKIAEELGKSITWVNKKLSGIKDKMEKVNEEHETKKQED